MFRISADLKSSIAKNNSSSIIIIWFLLKSELGFQSNWDLSVGGIKYPKHFGQSGHPIPLPVILTIAPARITR